MTNDEKIWMADLCRAHYESGRLAERADIWRDIDAAIKPGSLPGDGFDKTAERNGLILAQNIIRGRGGDG